MKKEQRNRMVPVGHGKDAQLLQVQAQEMARKQLYEAAKNFAQMISNNPESVQIKLMQEQFPDLTSKEIKEILETA